MARSKALQVIFNNDAMLLSGFRREKMRQKLMKRKYNFGKGFNLVAFACREIATDPEFDWVGTRVVMHDNENGADHHVGEVFHAFPREGVIVVIVDNEKFPAILAKAQPVQGRPVTAPAETLTKVDQTPPPPPHPGYRELFAILGKCTRTWRMKS